MTGKKGTELVTIPPAASSSEQGNWDKAQNFIAML